MRRTTTILLATLLAVGGVAGCSSNPDPEPAVTVTKTAEPSLSTVEARAVCVDAWARLLLEDGEAGVDAEPAECAGLPAGDRLDRYMEGMQKRNAISRG